MSMSNSELRSFYLLQKEVEILQEEVMKIKIKLENQEDYDQEQRERERNQNPGCPGENSWKNHNSSK